MDYQSEKKYIQETWETSPRQASHYVKKHNSDLFSRIRQLSDRSFSECCWIFVYGPAHTCETCGNIAKYLDFRRGYTRFCSTRCTANSSAVMQQKRKTVFEKHGVDHFSKTTEYRTKFEKTLQERYGVSNPGQIESLKSMRSRKKQETYFHSIFDKMAEFAVPDFTFDEYTSVRDTSLRWKCVSCGDVFESCVYYKLPKCPTCYPTARFGGQSLIEKEILEAVRLFYTGEIVCNSRELIPPREIDIYFPAEKLAIEVNGIYWHSKYDERYHREKFDACQATGIRLLMITDCDWQDKRDLVLAMIRHRLGISARRVYARQCRVVTLTKKEGADFFNTHHISGNSAAGEYHGLVYEGDIVGAISCSPRNRFNKNESAVEIIRLAFSDSVVGGASRLIKHLRKKYKKPIISYADLRYGTGEVYKAAGMSLVKLTDPGYWYFINGKRYHRLSWTKKKLVGMGYEKNKTEYQIMTEDLKALRYYDCGHALFRLE
jgi:hypothetical protein